MELEVGLIFTGKWFKGIVEVIKLDVEKNELEVKLKSSIESSSHWFETWNLKHTIFGIERRDYFL